MEKVIKTFENLGFTMRKYNINANNQEKYFKIVNDILRNNNKTIFYIIDDIQIIKKFMKNTNHDEDDDCIIMFNFYGDHDYSYIIFNSNNNYQVKNIENQFIFMLKNKLNIECCICFEKRNLVKCPDCIHVICHDCFNKMKKTNEFITCPCCREVWII